jgi:hypothetical protein
MSTSVGHIGTGGALNTRGSRPRKNQYLLEKQNQVHYRKEHDFTILEAIAKRWNDLYIYPKRPRTSTKKSRRRLQSNESQHRVRLAKQSYKSHRSQ